MTDKTRDVFNILNSIDVSDKVEKKNNLTYLSWAWAWGEVKKRYPLATYKVYENEQGWNYFNDGKTCWVKVSVTVEDLENIEYLPIMDYKNQSIPLEKVTSFNVNSSIQRALTKAIARHGLGLYIYAGEDLPETDKTKDQTSAKPKTLDQELLQEASSLGIDLEKVAVYLKKNVTELTNADLKKCINQKKKALGGNSNASN